MNERTRTLAAAIAPYADAALILSETNRFYYTGFAASDGALLASKEETVFYTDSRYLEAAAKKLGDQNVRDSKTLYEDLNAVFAAKSVRRVALEADRVTLAQFEELRERLPETALVTDASLQRTVDAMRSVKKRSGGRLYRRGAADRGARP